MEDKFFNRNIKFLHWLIDGRNQHGLDLKSYPNLTPEIVEEIYNVNFG